MPPAHDTPQLYAACTCPQLCDALNRRHTPRSATLDNPPGAYVTHVVAPAGGELRLDPAALRDMGVQRVVVVDADRKGSVRMACFQYDCRQTLISTLVLTFWWRWHVSTSQMPASLAQHRLCALAGCARVQSGRSGASHTGHPAVAARGSLRRAP